MFKLNDLIYIVDGIVNALLSVNVLFVCDTGTNPTEPCYTKSHTAFVVSEHSASSTMAPACTSVARKHVPAAIL